MKRNLFAGAVFFLTCALCGPGFASFEDRPAGARPAALAGAYGTSAGDIFGVPYNPAGLSQLTSTRIGFSFFRVFQQAEFSTFYAAFGLPLPNFQTLGLEEQFFGVPGYYSENSLYCSYGGRILKFRDADSINIGLSLGYLHKAFMNGSDTHLLTVHDGFGIDAGLLVISRLAPVFTVKGGFIYHKKQIDNIKDSFEAAISFLLIDRFSTSLDYDITQNALKIGEEIALLRNTLFLRAGLITGGPSSGEKDIGLGWMGKALAFDYALQSLPNDLALTHRFSISLDF
jgi:hypothetical protein